MLLSSAAGGANVWALLLPVLLLVLFWVVAIRPQRKRQRETAEMQQKVQPGQQVMTGAGLLATVHSVEADAVVLEIAPGVYARHVRQAIVRIMDSPTDGDSTADAESTSEDPAKGSGSSSTPEGPIKES
ncbi:preprotein translocase subunit YajC [Actinopolymorpha sp. B11F2]|uniref:preprotein translocase subunit YajC n=1 Tax=Actinopolymorpha sp. B11F2 TaxID=3160862 RepID=UPI0032E37C76